MVRHIDAGEQVPRAPQACRAPRQSTNAYRVQLREAPAEKPWFCIAMDATTCRVIAFHVADRSRERGEQR